MLAIGWSGDGSVAAATKTGALVGLLMWLGADLVLYAVFEHASLTGALADAVLSSVPAAAAGAAIGLATGKLAGSEPPTS
jgi:hypothetical protein